jgi:outer membrane protein assembly factor BamA
LPLEAIQCRDRAGRWGIISLIVWLLALCQPLPLRAQDVISGDSDACSGPAPQPHNDSFRFTRSVAHDAFTRSVAHDAVIGSIRFVRYNVFNMEDPRESNWLYRTANQLNVITWESVIRDQLLVSEGDSYNAARLAESERLLRDLDFIYDARVRPWRVCGNVVDLEVITRDTWTLSLEVGLSRSGGNDEYSLGLSDSNIFGSGKEIGFLREKDDDRSGYTFFYNDPALLGSRWHLNFTYSDNDDGYYRNLDVERPFFSVYEEWSAGARATQGKFEQATWFRGDEVTEFDQEYEILNAFGGIAVDVQEDERVGRWLFGLYRETNEFSFSDSNIPPEELPEDRDYAYPYIGYESIEDEYKEVWNMNYLGRTEDFFIGERYDWRLGWSDDSFGATRDQLSFGGSYGNTLLVDDHQMWVANAYLSGFWSVDQSEFENLWWTGETRFYHRQAHQWTLFVEGRIDFTDGLTQDKQVVLGGDTGLRGYDRNYQVGDRSFVISLEERYYSNWHPFRLFRVGAAAFVDIGRAWYDDRDNGENGGVLADAGVGLRLNSSRARKRTVIHIDLAFPLVTGDDVDSVQLLFRVRNRF